MAKTFKFKKKGAKKLDLKTILTFVILGVVVLGIIAGGKIVEIGTRFLPRASERQRGGGILATPTPFCTQVGVVGEYPQPAKIAFTYPSGQIMAYIINNSTINEGKVEKWVSSDSGNTWSKLAEWGDGVLSGPNGIIAYRENNHDFILVSDTYNNKLRKYDENGNQLFEQTQANHWGSPVNLHYPWGIAIDPQGYVWVAEKCSDVVQRCIDKYDKNLTMLDGMREGVTNHSSLAIDEAGYFYVSMSGNLYKFSFNPDRQSIWNTGSLGSIGGVAASLTAVYTVDSNTGKLYQLHPDNGSIIANRTGYSNPGGVGIDNQGKVYVPKPSGQPYFSVLTCPLPPECNPAVSYPNGGSVSSKPTLQWTSCSGNVRYQVNMIGRALNWTTLPLAGTTIGTNGLKYWHNTNYTWKVRKCRSWNSYTCTAYGPWSAPGTFYYTGPDG